MKKIFLVMLVVIQTIYAADFLNLQEAFKPKVTVNSDSHIEIDVELGEDIYLYEDRLKVKLLNANNVVIKEIQKPQSHEHDGDKVFTSSPHLLVVLAKSKDIAVDELVSVELKFQGCSEKGLCYEPVTHTVDVTIQANKLALLTSDKPKAIATSTSTNAAAPLSETDKIASTIGSGNIFLVMLSFLGFGLLLSFTPCIFPMIPILSSVIVSQGEGMTTKKAFFLSLVYVLSMAVAYTFAGVLAGLFGSNLQAAMQAPEVIISFALVFVGLSFSMFGYYELQMPNFIQSKLSRAGEDRGGVAGVAIMGFLSALIVGPCVAAPLAGALIYIGQTGDAVLGGLALFSLSMGMGMPLLVVGTTAGKFMPKPGGWMDAVKYGFGVMLLGVAIWMLSRVIPENVTMMLWAVLFIISALHLGALEPVNTDYDKKANSTNKKGFGILMLVYGLALFLGSISGATNVLNPLEKVLEANGGVQAVAQSELSFKTIHSNEELDAILKESKGKKVLVDFYADWCASCKEYEHITFMDANVKAKMNEFVLVQADMTSNSEEEKKLMKRFNLFGPPGIVFFDENSQKIEGADIVGYTPPEKFLTLLRKVDS